VYLDLHVSDGCSFQILNMLEFSPQILQYFALFLAGGGLSEAGDRFYWVWWSGKGWVFIGLELHYDKVNCTYGGGEKTRN